MAASSATHVRVSLDPLLTVVEEGFVVRENPWIDPKTAAAHNLTRLILNRNYNNTRLSLS